jgi:hypothetical protein
LSQTDWKSLFTEYISRNAPRRVQCALGGMFL